MPTGLRIHRASIDLVMLNHALYRCKHAAWVSSTKSCCRSSRTEVGADGWGRALFPKVRKLAF